VINVDFDFDYAEAGWVVQIPCNYPEAEWVTELYFDNNTVYRTDTKYVFLGNGYIANSGPANVTINNWNVSAFSSKNELRSMVRLRSTSD
jgi:hypothetical protein